MAEYEIELTNETVLDQAVEVDLGEEAPEDVKFEYDETEGNLVEQFAAHPKGIEALKDISRQVKDDFDQAWSSTEEYRQRIANDQKLFTGDLDPKTFPYENCANGHVPIMLENLTRLTFRAYAEIFGDWSNVFGVQANGPDDDALAEILTLHGNWQLREQIRDFPRQMHRAVLNYFTIGDVVAHSFWDPETELNRHEILTPDEFVIPYTLTSTMSDLSDVPYRVKIIHRYRHQLQAQRGYWYEVDKIIEKEPQGWQDDPEMPVAQATADIQRVEIPDADKRAPYKLLQYEGWLQLPNQDRDRFCRVVLDYDTCGILELAIHEQPNWQDQQRYDAQLQELDEYRQARLAHAQLVEQQALMLEQAEQVTAVAGPDMGPLQQMEVQSMLDQAVMGALPEPPLPPVWMANPDDPEEMPEPVKMEPIHLFSHAVCLEPMSGSLGLGFGRIQANFNEAANTALNQFIDQASLSNAKSWIADKMFQLVAGKMDIKPGAINYVEGIAGGSIKDHIMSLDPGPANPQLKELVGMMADFGQSSIQAPSVLSGEPGKSGETARGIASRIEQATKQLSVTSRKFCNELLEPVLRANAQLNAIYLKDEEIFHITDHQLKPATPEQPAMVTEASRELRVGRRMYERNYRVVIRADLRFTSMAQRIAEADEMLTIPKLVPAMAMNLPFQYKALVEALKARGKTELIPFLGPPPPPPQTAFGIPQQPPMGPPGAPPGAPGQPPGPQGPPQGGPTQ